MFVLQWRDFLHIGFDSRRLSHKSRNVANQSKCRFGAKISREIVNPTAAKFCVNVHNPRTEQSWEVMKMSVCRRKLIRICKCTENYMQNFDVTKPFNFQSSAGQITLQMLANERPRCRVMLGYCLGYKFRLLSPMRIAYGSGPQINVKEC